MNNQEIRKKIYDILKTSDAWLSSPFEEVQNSAYMKDLEALIQTACREARIDELEHVIDTGEGVSLNFDPEINPITREDRIKELQSTKEGKDNE